MTPRSKPPRTALPTWQAKLAQGATWPVLGAWCSHLPTLTICGQGMMFFFRKSPRGPVAGVMTQIDFQGWGLDELGIFNAASDTKVREDLLGKVRAAGHFLLKELPFDQAARILWSCAAYRDHEFEPGFLEDIAPYRAFIPPPTDTPAKWRSWLTASDGPLRADFLKLARQAAALDLPPGKELFTATRATFAVPDPAALLRALRKSSEEFEPLDPGKSAAVARFCWTRAYPKGHWSPLASRGTRQVIGGVTVSGNQVWIDTKTPSWSGRFADWLETKLPGKSTLIDVTWRSLDDLLGADEKPAEPPASGGPRKSPSGRRRRSASTSEGSEASAKRPPLTDDDVLGLHIDIEDYDALRELADYHPAAWEIVSSAHRNPRSGNVHLKGPAGGLRKLAEDLRFHLDERRVREHRNAYERVAAHISGLLSTAEHAD